MNTQLNTEENQNNKQSGKKIIERTQIENSYIYVLETEDGAFGVIGDKRITEVMETKEDVITYIEEKNWDTLGAIIAVLTEAMIKENEERLWVKINSKLFGNND